VREKRQLYPTASFTFSSAASPYQIGLCAVCGSVCRLA